MAPPLLIFDTNVVVDVWLERDGDQASLLVTLAETGKLELALPELVLAEFRGRALTWIREQLDKCESQVLKHANGWERSTVLGDGAERIKEGVNELKAGLETLRTSIEPLIDRLTRVAQVAGHTPGLHLKGELRFLRGLPPGRPGESLQDCRIYEAILEIARADAANIRTRRIFATRDRDFTDFPELVTELRVHGVELTTAMVPLYAELR